METFYYVYKVGGGRPTFKHDTYESALKEAQRLIDTVGGEFYILEAKALVKAAPKYVVQEPISNLMNVLFNRKRTSTGDCPF